jgi:hypothetical protein
MTTYRIPDPWRTGLDTIDDGTLWRGRSPVPGTLHSPQLLEARDTLLQKSHRRRKKTAKGVRIGIVGGGYNQFSSEAEEFKWLEMGSWKPQTDDFLATARDGGLGKAPNKTYTAIDEASFFGPLAQHTAISRVVYLGHGFGAHGGLMLTDRFEHIDEDVLKAWDSTIRQLRANFLEDAIFDIIACNVAAGESFLKRLAAGFGVRVRSFAHPIAWCRDYSTKKKRAVGRRGRITHEPAIKDYQKKVAASTGQKPETVPLPPSSHSLWTTGINEIFKSKEYPPVIYS